MKEENRPGDLTFSACRMLRGNKDSEPENHETSHTLTIAILHDLYTVILIVACVYLINTIDF